EFEDDKNKKNAHVKSVGKGKLFINGIKVTFSYTSETMYYYKTAISNLFVKGTLDKIGEVDELWSVHDRSCTVVKSFRREIQGCFGPYSESAEDRQPFGPANSSAFIYQTANKLETSSYWGAVSTYGGGGFVQYLTIDDRHASAHTISQLKANRWVDRGTRAIFIDFVLYNANINLFCISQLVFELPATGGVITSSALYPQRLIRYVTGYDYFTFVCELLFVAFTVYYMIQAILEIFRLHMSYFANFWNCFDIVNLILYVVVIGLRVRLFLLTEQQLKQIPLAPPTEEFYFVNLNSLANAQDNFTEAMAVMLIFAWIKTMKYISFNKTMTQLTATLERSAKDIGGFSVMFFIFFLAYAQFGFLAFGTQNMFLAIINDSYCEVKSELSRQANDIEMIDIAVGYWQSLLQMMKLKKKETNAEGNDSDRFRDALLAEGYSEQEITDAFIKYDLTGQKLELEEMEMVEKELSKQNGVDRVNVKEQSKSIRDISILNHRVDHLEQSIFGICERIDTLVSTVKQMDLGITRKDRQASIDRAEMS
ncbi:Polycystin-2, partial [Toxocara canis]